MNKIYRVIWDKKTGRAVVVSENDLAPTIHSDAHGTIAKSDENRSKTVSRMTLVAFATLVQFVALDEAYAGAMMSCSTSSGTSANVYTVNGNAWQTNAGSSGSGWLSSCNLVGSGGLIFTESNTGTESTTTGPFSGVVFGSVDGVNSTAGGVYLYAPAGLTLNGNTTFNGHTVSGIAASSLTSTSTYAVTGAQLYSVSSSTSTALSSVNSLSTSVSGLSASVSTNASNIGSLSSGLSTTKSNVGS
ncbi:ESPR-type extended signal peptide-containing protein, partial [Burkholderia gladioli]|uniref:ESPR-type extended signal peptide-containing protein n=1 Tax=Burkholderia gladioli TaxID=28095 RepID=UPI003F79AB9C